MRALGAISAWATVEKLGKVADLVLKLSAIVVALLAVNFFILRPEVIGESVFTVKRIDLEELRGDYDDDGLKVPAVVVRVVERYERNRAIDARQRKSVDYDYRSVAKHLCDRSSPNEERDVVPMPPYPDCETWASYAEEWELNLVTANVSAPKRFLSRAELEDALARVRNALYFEEFYRVRNDGRAVADNVTVIPPSGYQLLSRDGADSAPLSPGNRREYHYRFKEPPINQFEITWDSRPTDLANWYVWAAIIAFAVVGALVVLNDVARSLGRTDPPSSPAESD